MIICQLKLDKSTSSGDGELVGALSRREECVCPQRLGTVGRIAHDADDERDRTVGIPHRPGVDDPPALVARLTMPASEAEASMRHTPKDISGGQIAR